MAPRYRITLTGPEREMLQAITRSGKTNAPKFIHARALLLCDAGPHGEGEPWKVADVARALGVSARTVEHLKEGFVEQGLEAALGRKPRVGPPRITFDGAFDARLTALSTCATAWRKSSRRSSRWAAAGMWRSPNAAPPRIGRPSSRACSTSVILKPSTATARSTGASPPPTPASSSSAFIRTFESYTILEAR